MIVSEDMLLSRFTILVVIEPRSDISHQQLV